ncbi:hypothetical protein AX16_003447 [Volvariella volvacea WC 439]|nr:hypothetical protein AX16_003447 [Volvariella volvacea WC 439]
MSTSTEPSVVLADEKAQRELIGEWNKGNYEAQGFVSRSLAEEHLTEEARKGLAQYCEKHVPEAPSADMPEAVKQSTVANFSDSDPVASDKLQLGPDNNLVAAAANSWGEKPQTFKARTYVWATWLGGKVAFC